MLVELHSSVAQEDIINFTLGNISPVDLVKSNNFEVLSLFLLWISLQYSCLNHIQYPLDEPEPVLPEGIAPEENNVDHAANNEYADEECTVYFEVLGTRFHLSMENHLHPLIKENGILSLKVRHISLSFIYGLSGHYMALPVTKMGRWSNEVENHSKHTHWEI